MGNKKINNIQKLTDTSLESVSVGELPLALDAALCNFGIISVPVGMFGATACLIARTVYSSKFHSATKKGNIKNAEKYAKTANDLTIATAVLSSMIPVGISAATIGTVDSLKHPEFWQATKNIIIDKLKRSQQ